MKKKMVAPIVITVVVVLCYALYFWLIWIFLNGWLRIVLAVIPVILSAVMIFVCRERINEIKGGEENDIGKY